MPYLHLDLPGTYPVNNLYRLGADGDLFVPRRPGR